MSISLSRRQWIVLTGVATVAFWIALGIIERSLPSGTPGIVAFEFVLVLVILPLTAAAIISLLTLVPLLINDRGYQPGQSWRSQTEWFGGPSKGVEAADEVTTEQIEARSKGTGGTSGSW